MERVDAFVPRYARILSEYICAEEHSMTREMALSEATEIGKEVLHTSPNSEQMFELHRRAQRELADRWSINGTPAALMAAREKLVEGDAIPLMLALLVPHDLAQRVHQENRWRRDHAKLAAMFEQVDSMMLIYDNEGYLDEVNPAFVNATGWSALAAAAGTAGVWTTPLPTDGTQRCRGEQRRSDGSTYIAEWSVSPIFGADGQLSNHVCIARDVTKQQQIEDSLRENDKLRAVATLAAGIAHDFNNLLGSIIGLAELCEVQAEAGTRMARNLGRIRQAGNKAAVLVRQMLDFSRQTPTAAQHMNFSALLEHVEHLLRAALPVNVQLRMEVQADAAVLVDPVQMEQVILNMGNNAAHAMAGRPGQLRIEVDRMSPRQPPAGAGSRHRPFLRLRLTDTGHGMPSEVLNKIFDPFYTTKPVGEGTGLGLSAAHGIVTAHGGSIEVSSTVDVGTTFSIFLPIHEGMDAVPASATSPATDPGEPAGTACPQVQAADADSSGKTRESAGSFDGYAGTH